MRRNVTHGKCPLKARHIFSNLILVNTEINSFAIRDLYMMSATCFYREIVVDIDKPNLKWASSVLQVPR